MSKLDLLVQEFETLNQKEETQVPGGFVSIERSEEVILDAISAFNLVCNTSNCGCTKPNT